MTAVLPILDVQHLTKTYETGAGTFTVLKDISFDSSAGRDLLDPRSVRQRQNDLARFVRGTRSAHFRFGAAERDCACAISDEDERARIRNEHVGFVFQNFQLIPTLTALENVTVPMELRGDRSARKLGVDLLQRVGLADRIAHYPAQLSGGEQQRVALARAFINRPKILFADEPTGNLDSETSSGHRDHARTQSQRRDRARSCDARSRRRRVDRAHHPLAQRRDGLSASFFHLENGLARQPVEPATAPVFSISITLGIAALVAIGSFPAQPGAGDRRTGAHVDRRRSCHRIDRAPFARKKKQLLAFVRRTAGA